jgi:transposase
MPVMSIQKSASARSYHKNMTHSVINHSKCIILYKAKRYKCITCGRTFPEHNPLSSVNDSISTYTKIEILHALRNHNNTFTHVASRFNVSIQKVSDIFDHHVQCKRLSLPEIMCIDEICTARISSYKYACVLLDSNSAHLSLIHSMSSGS